MQNYAILGGAKYTRAEFEPIVKAMAEELAALIEGLKAAEAVALAFDGKVYNARLYTAINAAQEQREGWNGNKCPRFQFSRGEFATRESVCPGLQVIYYVRDISVPGLGVHYFDHDLPRTFYALSPYIDENGRVIGAGLVGLLRAAEERTRRELFKLRDALDHFDEYANKAAAAVAELGRVYGEINPLFRAQEIRPYYHYDLQRNPYQERENEGIKTI